jgi:VWFA-related protein
MLAVLLSAAAFAQNPPSAEPTFRSDVQVVLAPVVVRDATGRSVGDLTADDFQLYDKGKRQNITSFSIVKRAVPATRSESAAAGAPGSETARLEPSAAASQRRSIAYVFDDLDSKLGNLVNLRQAALRHFQAGLPAGDAAAIYTFSGGASVEFTNDAAKLQDAVISLRVRLGPGHGDESPCPFVSYYLAHLIVVGRDQNALEAVTRQTMDCMGLSHPAAQNFANSEAQRQLQIGEQDTYVCIAALRRAIRQLEQRPGQRLLVLASSGFFAPTKEGNAAFAGILDLAARAKVTISTLDARGLYLTAPDATRHAVGSLEQQYYRSSARAAEGSLQDLAEGSGGTFFHNNNDLAAGFEELSAAPEFSYVIGFLPSPLKADGSFHTLSIRLANQKGATIQARHGYFAPGKSRAEDALAEQLDDAVFSREEITDIPLDLVVEVVKSGAGAAQLLLVSKVYIKSLPFENAGGRNRDILTVVSAIYDEDGGYVAGNRNTINLAFRDETLAQAENPAIRVESKFHEIKPGNYLARVVARESGRRGLSARKHPGRSPMRGR